MEGEYLQNPQQDEQQDLRKVCILNLKKDETDEYVRTICEMYGEVVDVQRPQENLAFATFKSEW